MFLMVIDILLTLALIAGGAALCYKGYTEYKAQKFIPWYNHSRLLSGVVCLILGAASFLLFLPGASLGTRILGVVLYGLVLGLVFLRASYNQTQPPL